MNLDIQTAGRPARPHAHHSIRMALSLVAAVAGGLGAMGVLFLLLGTVNPVQAAITYGGVLVLLAIWATGIWWRWDSPDRRGRQFERERRGF
jgi:hypothetical protein